jgi:hypothetical protein
MFLFLIFDFDHIHSNFTLREFDFAKVEAIEARLDHAVDLASFAPGSNSLKMGSGKDASSGEICSFCFDPKLRRIAFATLRRMFLLLK